MDQEKGKNVKQICTGIVDGIGEKIAAEMAREKAQAMTQEVSQAQEMTIIQKHSEMDQERGKNVKQICTGIVDGIGEKIAAEMAREKALAMTQELSQALAQEMSQAVSQALAQEMPQQKSQETLQEMPQVMPQEMPPEIPQEMAGEEDQGVGDTGEQGNEEPDAVTLLFEDMQAMIQSDGDDDAKLEYTYLRFLSRVIHYEPGETKDFDVAEQNRIAGNNCFKNKRLQKALTHYNLGIVKCPQDTDEGRKLLSILISNRSAVFMEKEEYEKVLADIALIYKHGNHPDHLSYKIPLRKAKCLEALLELEQADEAYEDALEILRENTSMTEADRKEKLDMIQSCRDSRKVRRRKIRRPESKMYEDVHNFKGGEKYIAANPIIDFVYDEKNGRHAVATKDIPIGTLILKEEAHVSLLMSSNAATHCQHCLASVDRPLPCPKCANVVFCSARCQEIAEESYHRFECSIYGTLRDSGKNTFLVFRLFTQRGFAFFNDQRNKLSEYLKNENDMGLSEKEVYRHDDYDNIMFLYRNQCRGDDYDVYTHYSTAFVLRALKYVNFFPYEATDNVLTVDELFIGKLVLRHSQMVNYNAHGIGEIKPQYVLGKGACYQMTRIAVGLFPTFALFNHACEPSVIRTYVNSSVQVRTIKPIKAGDIIYDNYSYHFLWTPKEERQKSLETIYNFKCECRPCEENWPGVDALEPVVRVPCRSKDCNHIISVTLANPNPERCDSCHRRLHRDAINSITAPIHKYREVAHELYKERKYGDAMKMYVRVLNLMYKYTDKPDLDMVRIQENIDFSMAHFGNKSPEYYSQ